MYCDIDVERVAAGYGGGRSEADPRSARTPWSRCRGKKIKYQPTSKGRPEAGPQTGGLPHRNYWLKPRPARIGAGGAPVVFNGAMPAAAAT